MKLAPSRSVLPGLPGTCTLHALLARQTLGSRLGYYLFSCLTTVLVSESPLVHLTETQACVVMLAIGCAKEKPYDASFKWKGTYGTCREKSGMYAVEYCVRFRASTGVSEGNPADTGDYYATARDTGTLLSFVVLLQAHEFKNHSSFSGKNLKATG